MNAILNLTDVLTEAMGKAAFASNLGSVVLPLKKPVQSGTNGMREYTFAGDRNTLVSNYKFLVIKYWKESFGSDNGWHFQFCLACFPDGGKASQKMDSLTVLNYMSPKEIMNALQVRIDAVGSMIIQ